MNKMYNPFKTLVLLVILFLSSFTPDDGMSIAITPALIGVGAKIAGTAFDAINTNANISRTNEYRERAQRNQYEYNRRLAAQENQYNLANWHRTNEYNSPVAMRRRGVNPDLAYGMGSTTNASVPQASAGRSVDPVDYSSNMSHRSIAADMVNNILPAEQMKATTENIKADTQLKQVEASKTTTETSWIDRMNNNVIDLNNARILLSEEESSRIKQLTPVDKQKVETEIANIQKSSSQIDANIERIRQETANMEQSVALKKIDQAIEANRNEIQMIATRASASLDEAKRSEIFRKLPHVIRSLMTGAKNTDLKNIGIEIMNGKLSLDIEAFNRDQRKSVQYDAWNKGAGGVFDAASIFMDGLDRITGTIGNVFHGSTSRSSSKSYSQSDNTSTIYKGE